MQVIDFGKQKAQLRNYAQILILLGLISCWTLPKNNLHAHAGCQAKSPNVIMTDECGEPYQQVHCSINASPYVTRVSQTNGDSLNIHTSGNMYLYYTETDDGYTVLQDENDFIYRYAEKDNNGKLVASTIIAHDPGNRQFNELGYLQTIAPHLRHSDTYLDNLNIGFNPPDSIQDPSFSFPTTGTQNVLLLLIDYPTLPSTTSQADFDNFMNQPNYNGTGSFRDFYLDNSFGQLDLHTDVFGWYTAQNPHTFYGHTNPPLASAQLVGEAVDAAEAAGVDFSKYDNDGDGTVDGIMVVHSGPGAEEGGNTQYIWSHRWVLSGAGQARNYDGVLINDYMINPERRSWGMVGIGVFCHEFGHGLGLPDLYDIDQSSNGIGEWGVMGSCGWLNLERTPCNFGAWSKIRLGWLSATDLTANGSYQIAPSDDNNVCYKISTPVATEYFLVENRQKQGWDTHLKGHGLAIWHIDESSMTSTNFFQNTVNANDPRRGVDLEEADGLNQMDARANRGDGGDLFPGTSGNTSFTDSTNPDAQTNGNSNTNVCIQDITESGAQVSFFFGCGTPPAACTLVPNFTATTNTNLVVNFQNTTDIGTSTPASVNYVWDLGDNSTTRSDEDPIHTYTAAGTYTVCLTVTSDCETNPQQHCDQVTVSCSTNANFVATNAQPCQNTNVTFTNNSSAPLNLTYEWLVNGTVEATTEDFTFNFANAVNYTVALHATDGSGCLDTVTQTISVQPAPTSDFSHQVNGFQVDFTNLSTDATTHSWEFGDGNISASQNPMHIYDNVGNYNVKLTTTNNCSSTEITKLVVITPAPCTLTTDFSVPTTVTCEGTTATFNSTNTEQNLSYEWLVDGSQVATTQHLTNHIFSAAGNHDVTLNVTDANSCTATQTKTINIAAKPTADFAFSANFLAVQFTNNSTNASGYIWNFGDGNSSNNETPSHTFAQAGDYLVCLITQSNDCGTDQKCENVMVTNAPCNVMAGFTASTTNSCVDKVVNFINTSTNVDSLQSEWLVDGNVVGNNTHLNNYIFSTAGAKTITLKVTDTNSCTDETQQTINIRNEPTSAFTLSLQDLLLTISNTSTDADTYKWDFGDGNTSNDREPTHTYQQGGTYDVCLEAASDCGTQNSCETVNVGCPLQAAFDASTNDPCVGSTVTFTNTSNSNQSVNNATYKWFVNNELRGQTENFEYTFNQTGSFKVDLTIEYFGSCTDSFSKTFNLLEKPKAGLSANINNLQVAFTADSDANANRYDWNFGDGNTATGQFYTYTYASEKVYNVCLTTRNACESTEICKEIMVGCPIGVDFAQVGNQTVCINESVSFTSSITDAGSLPIQYLWKIGDGTTEEVIGNEQNLTRAFSTAGVFSLSVTANYGDCSKIQSHVLSVETVPITAFSANTNNNLDVQFTSNSLNAVDFSWNFGDGNTSTERSPAYSYTAPGIYNVCLETTNDCGATSFCEDIQVSDATNNCGLLATYEEPKETICPYVPVTFINRSLNTTAATRFEWYVNDELVGEEADLTYAFMGGGAFSVKLLAIENATCRNEQSKNIDVFPELISDFNFEQTGQFTFAFTQKASNADTYEWDFDDGNSSTELNPTHTYAAAGNYSVCLTVENQCDKLVNCQNVKICDLTADFTAPAEACVGQQMILQNISSTLNATFSWTVDGLEVSKDEDFTYSFTNAGERLVGLTATDNFGCVATAERIINILPLPTTDFTATTNELTVTFDNTSTEADTYFWEFGNGETSVETLPSVTYADEGTYRVCLTVSNDCGDDTDCQDIVVERTCNIAVSFIVETELLCAGQNFVLKNTTSDLANYTYQWQIDGQNASTNNDLDYTLQQAGDYSITLIATDSEGCAIAYSEDITIASTPVASFDFSVDGLDVSFTNTSTHATQYTWDFGDGNSSEEENPTHRYAENGEYTACLRANNDCGQDPLCFSITINCEIGVALSSSATEICADGHARFVAQSDESLDYAWFINGTAQDEETSELFRVFEAAGEYTITLEVLNKRGCVKTLETQLTVLPNPKAAFDVTIAGLTVLLENKSTDATEFLWNMGDETVYTEDMPTHPYKEVGDYEICLLASNETDCAVDTSCQIITIDCILEADFSVSTEKPCPNKEVTFTIDTEVKDMATFQWLVNDELASTDRDFAYTFLDAGSQTITLNIDEAGCTSTASKTLEISNLPTAQFAFEVLEGNGLTVQFTDESAFAEVLNWKFDANSDDQSAERNPTYTYPEAGTYQACLTATNACEAVEICQEITLSCRVQASFISTETAGCQNYDITFINTSSKGENQFYDWYVGGQLMTTTTSTEEDFTHTFEQVGIISIRLVARSGNCESEQTTEVEIKPPAEADFSYFVEQAAQTVSFFNHSQRATSVNWEFGDGESSALWEPTHTYDNTGAYEVCLTAANECGGIRFCKDIFIDCDLATSFDANKTEGCTAENIRFTNTTSASGAGYQWLVNGILKASTSNFDYVFEESGIYTITLVAQQGSCNNSSQKTITILPDAKAAFSYEVSDLTIQLSDESSNARNPKWTFGDGSEDTGLTPKHTYTEAGTYEVCLTVESDAACAGDQYCETIELNCSVHADFEAKGSTGTDLLCAENTITFRNLSQDNGGNVAYEWQVNGETQSTSKDFDYEFAEDGEYTITLIAKGANCNDQVERNINIAASAKAAFDYNISGLKLELTNQSTDILSSQWTFGDGDASTTNSPTHTFSAEGTYEVCLTVTNSCGKSPATCKNITIQCGLTIAFETENDRICVGSSLDFSNRSESTDGLPLSNQWRVNNQFVGSDKNLSYQFDEVGTYQILLISSNGGCSGTATKTVIVEPSPLADFEIVTNGLTIAITNTSRETSDNAQFNWTFADEATATGFEPTYTFEEEGKYDICLTVDNQNACATNELCQTVELSCRLVATFEADQTQICAGETVNFTSTTVASSSAVISWWIDEDLLSANTTFSRTFAEAGAYAVELVVNDGGCVSNQIKYVVVLPPPLTNFTFDILNLEVEFSEETIGADSFLWDFGNGETSTQANPKYTYPEGGAYEVCLTTTNECGAAEPICKTVDLNCDLEANFVTGETTRCLYEGQWFENTSNASGTATFEWILNGELVETKRHYYNAFITSGEFELTLHINDHGCVDSRTETITVLPTVIPDFDYVKVGNSVAFTNRSEGADTYHWTFGDGIESEKVHPSHTYLETSKYRVCLTATNPCSEETHCEDIDLGACELNVDFARAGENEGDVCIKDEVRWNSDVNGTGNKSYQWLLDGEVVGTESSFTHVFEAAGQYGLELVVNNGVCEKRAGALVIVYDTPSPDFDYETDETGLTVAFDNTSASASSYEWNFGDGKTSAEENPTHTYEAAGDYEVCLTAGNNCSSVVETCETISISLPEPENLCGMDAFFALNDDPSNRLCEFRTVDFVNQSSYPEDMNIKSNWYVDGEFVSNEFDFSHTFSTMGDYNIRLDITDESGDCIDEYEETIHIHSMPKPELNFSTSGLTATFMGSAPDADYFWWRFGNDIDSITNVDYVEYTYAQPGTYVACFIPYNDCGGYQKCIEVTVGCDTEAKFTASSSEICEGESILFTNNSVGNNDLSYEWEVISKNGAFIADAVSYDTNREHTFLGIGEHTIRLTVMDGESCVDVHEETIMVQPKASGGFFVLGGSLSVQFIAFDKSGSSYTWDFGDGTTLEGEADQTHEFKEEGIYEVCLSITNDCGSGQDCQTVEVISFSGGTSSSPVPVAVNDLVTMNQGQSIDIDVLANDSHTANGDINITAFLPASNGTVVYEDGGFVYTPDLDFVGTDSFIYQICDIQPLCVEATVFIEVLQANCQSQEYLCAQPAETMYFCPTFCDLAGEDYYIAVVRATQNANIQLHEGTCLAYTPTPLSSGTVDSLAVIACNAYGKCDTSYALIEIGTCDGTTTGKLEGTPNIENWETVDLALTEKLAIQQIVPNPAVDRARLDLSMPAAGQVQITIYNLSGRVIHQSQQQLSSGLAQIDLSVGSYPAGIYMVTVETNSEVVNTKLIKQ